MRSNPFSTKFVRPGTIPFLGVDQTQLTRWANAFVQQRLGQIVGPHGSGKSALTFALERPIANAWMGEQADEIQVRRLTFGNRGQLQNGSGSRTADDAKKLFVVDGIERLNLFQRMAFFRKIKMSENALLITTHRHLRGVPVIATIEPTVERLKELVRWLDDSHAQMDSRRLREVFEAHRGDLRECLMTLYDDWEQSRGPK